MAVRIRLKRLGRTHRPFFRVCAMDCRSPRDGRAIEELGTYDPMVKDRDARAILNGERIDYWLSVGAQPSDKVKVLIKKYGTNGSHLSQQAEALEKLKIKPQAPPPVKIELPKPETPAEPESGAGGDTAESGGAAPSDAANSDGTTEVADGASPEVEGAAEEAQPADGKGEVEKVE